jgi:UDP-3-O-[3-hydroxymyristoyl] glucosamine N-acyltransferase
LKLKHAITLKEAAELLSCSFVGNPEHLILGLNEIHVVEEGDAVFVDHPKYYSKALQSKATTIIIDKEVECPEGKGLLVSSTPFDDFNFLTRQFSPFKQWVNQIGENFKVGENTIIHPNVTIGHDVSIGDNCMIHSGAVIGDNTLIGNNVIVQSNTVLGSQAFYYKAKPTGRERMHTCGRVVLQDNVEIGAMCTIDAGVTGNTYIGEGTKIDNMVHVGHDTTIGKNCLFAAQVGIAGCVIIEDNVTLWGQVGVTSGVRIGEKAIVSGCAGVSKNLEGGKLYFGIPAEDARIKYKELAAIRSLPKIIENL